MHCPDGTIGVSNPCQSISASKCAGTVESLHERYTLGSLRKAKQRAPLPRLLPAPALSGRRPIEPLCGFPLSATLPFLLAAAGPVAQANRNRAALLEIAAKASPAR